MEVQLGWRSCSRCQGFINVSGMVGTCLGNQMHEFSASAEYRAVWSTFPPNVQPGWGSCIRCGRMAYRGAAGICWDGAAHEYDQWAPDYGVPYGPDHPDTQGNWRWCSRCQCLNDASNTSNVCFAGGPHTFDGSLEYCVQRIGSGMQGWWGWCRRCSGVLSGEGQGVCHDGDRHGYDTGTLFTLAFGIGTPGTQPGWRRCAKCAMLTLTGRGAGACYAGGGHDFSGPYDYNVLIDVIPATAQPAWRRCAKCQVLTYTGVELAPCAAGDVHDVAASPAYGLWPTYVGEGQPAFRACARCESLVSVLVAGGECRGGGAHDVVANADYVVTEGFAPDGGESSWRRCARCQALVYGGAEPGGRCFDGGTHDLTDSMLYGTFIEPPQSETEAGWGRCNVCHQLVRTAGATHGCHLGLPHDLEGSASYVVAVVRAPEPPPPAGPRLTITEQPVGITFVGSGFPAGGAVKLTIRLGAAQTSAGVVAGETGEFTHNITDVTANTAGATVLAATESGELATGRLSAFVPVEVAPVV